MSSSPATVTRPAPAGRGLVPRDAPAPYVEAPAPASGLPIAGEDAPDLLLDAPRTITVFRDEHDARGHERTTSWRTWIAGLLAHDLEPDARAFAPAIFVRCPAERLNRAGEPCKVCHGPTPADRHRLKDNARDLMALVLDYDGGKGGLHPTTIDEAAALWCFSGVLYTTKSHLRGKHGAPAVPRFRVVLPLPRPVSPAEHAAVMRWAFARAETAGHKLDRACRNPDRLWFYPPTEATVIELRGPALDVQRAIDEAQAPATPPPQNRDATPRPSTPGRPDAFARAVAWLASPRVQTAIQGQDGSGKLAYAACAVARGFDLSDADAYAALAGDWNRGCVPPWSTEELQRAIGNMRANGTAFTVGELLRADRHLPPRPTSKRSTPRTQNSSPVDVDDDAAEAAAIQEEGNMRTNAAEPDTSFPPADDATPAPRPKPRAVPPQTGQEGAPLDPPRASLQLGTIKGTDLANAERFGAMFARRLIHVEGIGWKAWTGRTWGEGETEAAQYAKDLVRCLGREAKASKETDTVQNARRAQQAKGIASMLQLARTEGTIARTSLTLDRDPMLLSCLNGTLDLRTGALREHRPEDWITHLCPVAYDPSATSVIWDQFLRDATADNEDLAAFLRRAVGYSLTGLTDEEVLFLVHGERNTGKSTFIGAVKAILGTLAKTTDFNTFVEQRFSNRGGPTEDLARLAGARFVSSIEVEEGARLAHSLVKHVTGKEVVTARFLHKDSFEYLPQFKLWLVANAAPRVDHSDGGMWRRILRVPLDQVVPLEKRDPKVKAHLIDSTGGPGEGAAAVLAWAVCGCLEWQQTGLKVPEIIRQATEDYRQANDPLREYIAARCVVDTREEAHGETWVLKPTLRADYEGWCREIGAKHPIGPKPFVKYLRGLGCIEKPKRVGPTVGDAWFGIRLRQAGEYPAE